MSKSLQKIGWTKHRVKTYIALTAAAAIILGEKMSNNQMSSISEILKKNEKEILEDWVKAQLKANTRRSDLISEASLRRESSDFLRGLIEALDSGVSEDINAHAWAPVRQGLTAISSTRGEAGFSPTETATFIFSLKQPIFERLRLGGLDAEKLSNAFWDISVLLDKLGLYTTEIHQTVREKIIKRQQEDMLELSTPVVKLWEGILALPMIGTLDSSRTQVVMETLLQRIVETGSEIAIIDITGVPMVDTLVAQHLLKTVTAARLMGAECIISGIRPQIAATIVHLGVDLKDIVTKSNLADAFLVALGRLSKSQQVYAAAKSRTSAGLGRSEMAHLQ